MQVGCGAPVMVLLPDAAVTLSMHGFALMHVCI